jgi:hypothetical protein
MNINSLSHVKKVAVIFPDEIDVLLLVFIEATANSIQGCFVNESTGAIQYNVEEIGEMIPESLAAEFDGLHRVCKRFDCTHFEFNDHG